MKYLLTILSIVFVIPCYALCPVDAGESVCTLPNFKTNNIQSFQNKKTENILNNSPSQLQPLQRDDLFEKMRTPNNELMKYDSGCQFGSCVQDLNQNITGER